MTIFSVLPSSGSKKPMPVGFVAASECDGSKSPKTVKAAVFPVLWRASRLPESVGCGQASESRLLLQPAGLPPPVAGLSEVNAKLVGVERAARAALDAQVEPGMHNSGLNSQPLRTPSAVFSWQPRQNA